MTGGDGAPHAGRGRAVVVGASMAGLLAARVLSDHFGEVVVLDRDPLPVDAVARRGLPQAAHAHVLLERGLRLLEGFFPGFITELGEAGAEPVDCGREALWLTPRGWSAAHDEGALLMSCSRDLLDAVVRRRLRALAPVRLEERTAVTGLLASPDAGRVCGVKVAGDGRDQSQRFAAELVVDASGRGSPAPRWLAELGYGRPAESVVDADVGYATRLYARRPGDLEAPYKGIYQQLGPPRRTRGGFLAPIEEQRWLLTLTGTGGDHPPGEVEGFDRFLHDLDDPLPGVVRGMEPIGDVRIYRATRNRLRHYERMRLPAGLLLLGDTVCAFNPVYGQGLTTAALAALTLDRSLQGRGDLSRRFQRRLAHANRAPWLLATGEDYRVPTVRGERPPPGTALLHAYAGRVFAASTRTPGVARRLQAVMHMRDSPLALLRPPVLLAALGPRGRALPDAMASRR
ncbi:MAG: NAD(P)/FAD-dependent oxidoreductase [Egibacteraceae bacterium]